MVYVPLDTVQVISETGPTLRTALITQQTHTEAAMDSQPGVRPKRSSTSDTRPQRRPGGVRSSVSQQRVRARECTAAHRAAVRPLSGVNAHVLAQVAGAHEAPVAVGAGERAPVGRHVDGRVTVQRRRRAGTTSAHAAQVTAIAADRRRHVRPAVTVKRTGLDELATTHRAQETLSTDFS